MTQLASPAPDTSRAPNVRPGQIVFVLAFAGITAAITQTMVVPLVAELPQLLHTTASNASWVVTATLLAAAVATPVSGRLGDLYGKRKIMLICALILTAGSAVCALSDSVVPMIVGRAMQGVGMGIIPLGISAMRDLIPAEKLGSSIALMSASMGVGGALGLPLSAAIAQSADWTVLFWVATALSVAIFALILLLIPATPVAKAGRFDLVGAIGLGIGLICLLLGVSKGADWGWTSGTTLGCLIVAVVVLVAWGAYELRISDPLVDLRVTARPVVLLTNVAAIVVGMSMYAQSLIIPQLLQLPEVTGFGLGQSMLEMGLWMLPGGLMMMLASPVGAKISHARGPRITLAIGAGVMALGYLATLFLMGSTWGLMIAVCIITAGVGLAYGAMPALIMGSVPRSETGSANSFNTLMRSIGTTVSAAIVGVVLSQMTQDLGGYTLPTESGFQIGLAIGGGAAVVAALVALAIPAKASAEAEGNIEHDLDHQSAAATER
ncbi:MFS transporter [Nocardioides insulae]|uniref:MFS transporter n=1 Tax=Nocardioides insulae TaxID=394734 RepID=UPI000422E940|nr:MFS transporter [Nocardioides insulae]